MGFPSWLYFLSLLTRTWQKSGLRGPSGVRIFYTYSFPLIQRKKLDRLESLLAVLYHDIIFWVFNFFSWGLRLGSQVYNPVFFCIPPFKNGYGLWTSLLFRDLSCLSHILWRTPYALVITLICSINILSQISSEWLSLNTFISATLSNPIFP